MKSKPKSKATQGTKKDKAAPPGKASKPPLLDNASASSAELRKALGIDKKGATKAKPSDPAASTKPTAPLKKGKVEGQLSALDAAAKVLADAGTPLRCVDMVKVMLEKGLWSTQGKTPAATLYSAILREIDGKPGESRFTKTDRGLFGLTTAKKS